ncbi:MAG: class I tRNA ligase family protein, partial [Nitrospirota bacterium]|nr:class I tRNA ligase family protein [Nitrospirota bacterium]
HHPDGPVTRQTLVESFEIIQRLLHPVMPFITEEIWQSFPHEGLSIMTQRFPTEKPEWTNTEAEQVFSIFQSFINTARTARALLNVSSSQTPYIYAISNDGKFTTTLESLQPYLESLLKSKVELANWNIPPRTLELPTGNGITLGIQIPDQVDLQEVHKKIKKQLGEKEQEIQRLDNRLSSPNFIEKAEDSVKQESKDRLAKLNNERQELHLAEQQFANLLNP